MTFDSSTGDAADAVVEREGDREVHLSSFWAERRVAFIFLRHFG
jgi:hypothetical protein